MYNVYLFLMLASSSILDEVLLESTLLARVMHDQCDSIKKEIGKLTVLLRETRGYAKVHHFSVFHMLPSKFEPYSILFQSAAIRVKAEALVDSDRSLLQLPWKTYQQMMWALEDKEKVEAVHRILVSSVLTDKPLHFVSCFVDYFLAPELAVLLFKARPRK